MAKRNEWNFSLYRKTDIKCSSTRILCLICYLPVCVVSGCSVSYRHPFQTPTSFVQSVRMYQLGSHWTNFCNTGGFYSNEPRKHKFGLNRTKNRALYMKTYVHVYGWEQRNVDEQQKRKSLLCCRGKTQFIFILLKMPYVTQQYITERICCHGSALYIFLHILELKRHTADKGATCIRVWSSCFWKRSLKILLSNGIPTHTTRTSRVLRNTVWGTLLSRYLRKNTV